jgi:hypothetical protein
MNPFQLLKSSDSYQATWKGQFAAADWPFWLFSR